MEIFILKTEISITTGHSLGSTKKNQEFEKKMTSKYLSIFKSSKNRNSNNSVTKGKCGGAW